MLFSDWLVRQIMEAIKKRILKEKLTGIALGCYEAFREAPSRREALKVISGAASAALGPYLHPHVIENPDDIAVGFIDLLDQIIFEMEEDSDLNDDSIQDYIVDDLYQRAEAYLDFFKGIDHYRNSVRARIINQEDALIIGQCRLGDLVPQITSEFYEQPNMRFALLRALVLFEEEDLLHFFFDVAKNDYGMDLKILALLGMKKSGKGFTNWKMLRGQGDEAFEALLDYVPGFSLEEALHDSPDDDNISILYFKMLYIELFLKRPTGESHCRWILKVLNDAAHGRMDDLPFQNQLYSSLSGILFRLNCDSMKSFLRDEENLKTFLHLLDALPAEVFDRAIVMLDYLGDDFVSSVGRLVSRGRIKWEKKNSNLMAYLFSLGFDPEMI